MKTSFKLVAGMLLLGSALTAQAQYQAKLVERSKAWGSVVADFNKDGHDDIYITGHDPFNDRVWLWTSKGYTPSAQIFPDIDRHDCDAADVNHDGLIDLYCAIGAEKGKGVKANELWLLGADGTFTAAAKFGAEDPYGRGRIPLFFDFNHDGWPDIYMSNLATPRADGKPNINHVFVNQAGHGFVEVVTGATGGYGSQCVAKGDINGDGWDDLAVCNENGLGHLFINNRAGDLVDMPNAAQNGEWQDAKLVDMNGDGRVDLVLVTAFTHTLQVWLNTGTGTFFDTPILSEKLPYPAWSIAIGDFNKDGLRDIYVVLADADCLTTGHDLAPDLVYWGQPGGGWVKEQLVQDYLGCGHLADVVDGSKVLLENGGVDLKGPNYILSWTR